MEPDLPQRNRPGVAMTARRSRARQRGQGLVIFVGAIVFLIGLLAIVVDVTWYWAKTLQVQRAADAAALAGAVWLPDQPALATTVAIASAKQNGYVAGAVPGGVVTVTAVQNSTRDIQLDTSVSAPVPTFFMRLFGINTLQATRTAKAEYALPVPMGSPLNYFGAFGELRGWIFKDTGLLSPTTTQSFGTPWTDPTYAYAENETPTTLYATTANATNTQTYGGFHIPMPAVATDARFLAYGGIEVVVKAKSSLPLASGCKLQAEVTSNASASPPTWYGITAPNQATNNPAALTDSDTVITFGGAISSGSTDATDWWRTSGWTTTNFADGNFAVRLKAVGGGSCATATTSVDYIKVRVTHEQLSPLITGPGGEPLNKQGVWAGVLSQGSDVMSGDIYSPQYNNKPALNTQYSPTPPTPYYNYAIEMQPGTTNGSVYVFDPVFCATKSDFTVGMGDHYYGSGDMTMSTFYDLYDTNNTPYDPNDDTWIAGNTPATLPVSQGGGSNPEYNLFRRANLYDASQSGTALTGSTDCQRGKITDPTKGGYWHNRWWPLATGIDGPPIGSTIARVYRIHVTSTDPAAAADQSSTNALNNFSLFATVGGHTCPTSPADAACPRVYGLGSMEAFSPLDPSSTADLYLSQIGMAYAGKTIKVSLWDAGDTNNLSAVLSFRMPTSGGYQDASFTWTATKFATSSGAANCNGSSAGAVPSVTTSYGSGGLFNGCWLTILIAIPTTYTAPTPPGEPGPGWWKIRYTMGGGSSPASDLTTWKTQIIGNPVHLVVP